MSKDFNDISKEILKNNKEIHNVENKLTKDISNISKEISSLKKEVKDISNKINEILEILNMLTIFIEETNDVEEIDEDEEYQSNEGWLPEINNWEDNYEEDDDEQEP